jgi:serine/threonine-protein kinase RsbW
VNVQIRLRLPRDTTGVPIARQTLRSCLDSAGVPAEIRDDVTEALSEACADVVQHATGSDHYEVQVTVTAATCVIDVIDAGPGIDPGPCRHPPASAAEPGHRLQLIIALTDTTRPAGQAGRETIMHFEKLLHAHAPPVPSATPAT